MNGRDVITGAARFADVDLVSFTNNTATKLACGERAPADAVYVTWRRDTGMPGQAEIAGVAVALEFVPPGFVP